MSIDLFVPEIWSARLLRHRDAALIYAQQRVCNRDWEGEISEAGDTVHIQKVGDPSVFTYVPGVDMPSPERPEGTTKALVVDQLKAFNVAIDDVDKAQSNVTLLDKFGDRAGVQVARTVDGYVAAQMVLAALPGNTLGSDDSPITIDASHTGAPGAGGVFTPHQFCVELRRLLAANEAEEDLWVAIDTDIEAEFLMDGRFIEADQGRGDQSLVRTGKIGDCAGFEVLRTTRVPKTVNATKVVAGAGNYATTFANQLTEMEAFRIEAQFGDGVKGLEVYGAKIVEPETLALAHVAGGTGGGSGSGSGSGG